MADYSAQNLLELWEKSHGALADKWKPLFLAAPEIPEILEYRSHHIDEATKKYQKLKMVLRYLTENFQKTNHKWRPVGYDDSDESADKFMKLKKGETGPVSEFPTDDWWRND